MIEHKTQDCSYKIGVQATALLKLDEPEMQALAALTAYGIDSLLKAYYSQLGSQLKPCEAGLRSLFKKIDRELMPVLNGADAARKVLQAREIAQTERQHG